MASEVVTAAEQAAEAARGSFSTGCNCAESVLENVAVSLQLGDDALARSSGYAWTGGIDESGCLCGALSAAVSLAGQVAASEGGTEAQQRTRARELAEEIRREFVGRWRGTCCRIVRDGRAFGTPECVENCGNVTAFTTQLAVDVLGRERDVRETARSATRRVATAIGTGLLLGLEAAWIVALFGSADASVAILVSAFGVGLVFGVLSAARVDVRRALARPGRYVAAASVGLAAVLATISAVVPAAAAATNAKLALATGVPAAFIGTVWVLVMVAWAAPAVFNLARRRGAR